MPAAQNILLACRAVGLGASLTTLHLSFGAEVDAKLGLPDGVRSCALLPIGWPIGRYGRPPRKAVDQCLHFDRFQAGADRREEEGARGAG
jgi:nitroreductase